MNLDFRRVTSKGLQYGFARSIVQYVGYVLVAVPLEQLNPMWTNDLFIRFAQWPGLFCQPAMTAAVVL